MNFKDNFKKAYTDLYNLHPSSEESDFRFRYLKVDWFFPNHINNVLRQVKTLAAKYFEGANLEVALYGGLFHDAGLVYKRETADPSGHEVRSIEYAVEQLKKLGYDDTFIGQVTECIKATQPDSTSSLPEAFLVRNADAYAHIVSMHFFAKANFSQDIHTFINWFASKLETTYSKLTIPDLQQEVEPLINFYRGMITNYRLQQDGKDFLGESLI